MAEAISVALFIIPAIAGSISGGYNAVNSQKQIEDQYCKLNDALQNYKTYVKNTNTLLQLDELDYRQKLSDLQDQISSLNRQIKISRANFKKTYNRWVIFFTVFMIVLVFIFATKKFILGATTEPY